MTGCVQRGPEPKFVPEKNGGLNVPSPSYYCRLDCHGARSPAENGLRVGLFPREYPPNVYGGAGVHVEYLSRELARKVPVEVYCWGRQHGHQENLHVTGQEPWEEISRGTEEKFKGALEALSLNLTQVKALNGIDVVHTHTWYVSMAGFLAKKLYDVPFVLTTHSLEPLRAWKAEQLGTGYALSSWIERTAILDADAVIAVSSGTKDDILRAYPVDPERIHVIYNGIDLQQYRRTPETAALTAHGVDPAIPYVLFVGRITRQKGVTHLWMRFATCRRGSRLSSVQGLRILRTLQRNYSTKWRRHERTT